MSELTKILHVEDDPEILEIAEMALGLIGGFEIVQADRGEKALDLLESAAPQLILSDVQMPGLTGPETLAAIRATPGFETIPGIYMTAKLLDAEKGALCGPYDLGVIAKPFDPTTLPDQIRELWAAGLETAA
ncbi:response regulator [Pelagimonas sp. KU-00592-HH]|jgi:CheY-like chemotaxis protein|uniref:response regulator n=1 Tax=Roseobacteraceae TaxID=2854170 RepID=UPI0020CD745E|nr:response regulator [Shimia sp. CNT1-13L.2]MCP9481097.1 response regulator [Shimia sp. CNT1-13L.2]